MDCIADVFLNESIFPSRIDPISNAHRLLKLKFMLDTMPGPDSTVASKNDCAKG